MRTNIFSLIELLLSIAIIALLAGLLFPVINNVRRDSTKTSCLNNLRQIGVLVTAYVENSNGRLPVALRIGEGPNDPGALINILESPPKSIFQCPGDTTPNFGNRTHFERYGTSYEWNAWVNGRLIEKPELNISGVSVLLPIMADAENFHGSLGKNCLRADGSASRKMENELDE